MQNLHLLKEKFVEEIKKITDADIHGQIKEIVWERYILNGETIYEDVIYSNPNAVGDNPFSFTYFNASVNLDSLKNIIHPMRFLLNKVLTAIRNNSEAYERFFEFSGGVKTFVPNQQQWENAAGNRLFIYHPELFNLEPEQGYNIRAYFQETGKNELATQLYQFGTLHPYTPTPEPEVIQEQAQ